jgi:NAD(P)-dependent dehydrogenase (short-subunit alcohol dehydrogenase family)
VSRFDGRTVLIVGGAQGMGRACAELFGAEGANLALFDIEADTLATAAEALGRRGYPVETMAGDVSVSADVEAAVAGVVERFGTVDVMVHTAAIVELRPLLEFPEHLWRRIIDVNLTGVFLTTKAAGRVMAERGGGAIVVFASTNAFFAEESNVPYSTTKGGIVMFVRNAAMDLARHGIRINAIDPGIIDTRLSAALIHDPVAGPDYMKRIPAGRYGTPEDIAKVVVFLASDDAAYMTGEDVIVDGGLTLGATLGIEDLGLEDASG